jgi:hypothetical protein
MSEQAWQAIFEAYKLDKYDFDAQPFTLTADMIKQATRDFSATSEREPRLLCKQDQRQDRPALFARYGLFILPIKNGVYVLVRGEGYFDIPAPPPASPYTPQLNFELETAKIGDSEMQHLDYAYATSLLRTFMDDASLVLTIRGRKYTPAFNFRVGKHPLQVQGVQTEIDAGYEGREQVVLVEAKNRNQHNLIIRQLFYPLRQWSVHTRKEIATVLFEKQGAAYHFWRFTFDDPQDYNSLRLINSARFTLL